MDIELLSKMIAELILDHDEVGLPALGTFVAEFVPSSFSDKGYTINPPYRRLSFRKGDADDSLLVDFYSGTNNLDRDAARSFLTRFDLDLRNELESRKTVVFPGLGRLRATRDNCYFFVSDESLDIYPEGFGLCPVSLKTHSETTEEVSGTLSSLASMIAPSLDETSVSGVQESRKETPEPISVTESGSIPDPEPISDTVPASHVPTNAPARKRRAWLVALLVMLSLALLVVAVFFLLVHVAPDFIDTLLYTPEELEILRWSI